MSPSDLCSEQTEKVSTTLAGFMARISCHRYSTFGCHGKAQFPTAFSEKERKFLTLKVFSEVKYKHVGTQMQTIQCYHQVCFQLVNKKVLPHEELFFTFIF